MALSELVEPPGEKRDDEKRDSISSQNGASSGSQAPDTALDEQPPKFEPQQAEYPTGFKLACIILALILGIFLASLDMVKTPRDSFALHPN